MMMPVCNRPMPNITLERIQGWREIEVSTRTLIMKYVTSLILQDTPIGKGFVFSPVECKI